MVNVHSPWPLFCPDLSLAREWVLEGWRQSSTVSIGLAMLGPSLGLFQETRALLEEEPCRVPYPLNRQLAFRLARAEARPNPYTALLPEAVATHDQGQWAEVQRLSIPLPLELLGGIGDHLELLSLVLPWAARQQQPLRLFVSPTRQQQLATLLGHTPEVELIAHKQQLRADAFQALNLRGLIYNQGHAAFQTWIHAEPTNTPDQLICCWRAAGADAPHSAWCRSVPYPLVERFYRRLLAAGRPAHSITDLSGWRTWESAALNEIGIRQHDPSQGDLLDLAQRISGATVLTIDTALAHLCAAMGQPATVLLPRFPDERWMELLRPEHCYGQSLRIRRQTTYADWTSVLAELPIN